MSTNEIITELIYELAKQDLSERTKMVELARIGRTLRKMSENPWYSKEEQKALQLCGGFALECAYGFQHMLDKKKG